MSPGMFSTIKLKQPSFWRGLLLCFGLLLVIAVHCFKLPWFYNVGYVSQEILILIFLHSLFFLFLLEPNNACIGIGPGQAIVLGVSLFVWLTNWANPLGGAVLFLYILLFFLFTHSSHKNDFPLAVAFGAVFAAVLGLYQYIAIQLGVLPPLNTTRLAGTYGQPNLFAGLMLLGLFCYYQVLLTANKFKIQYHIPGLLLAVVLFLTGSRAGMLALVVSATIAFYLLIKYRLKQKILSLNLSLLGVLLLGYWLSSFFSKVTPLQRNANELAIVSGSVNSYQRFNDWFSSLWMGWDHLFSGVGIGNFKSNLSGYQIKTVEFLKFTYDSISRTLWAHNDFLHIFAENGIFVFIALVSLCLFVFVRFYTQRSFDKFFLYLGFISFLVMMVFGHPFRYHALVFSFVGVSAILISNEKAIFKIWKNKFSTFIACALIIIDCLFAPHFIHMVNLGRFQKEYRVLKNINLDTYKTLENKYLKDSLGDGLYSWQFQHELYLRLVDVVFFSHDRALGLYILPELLNYSEKNKFPVIAYGVGKVYYSLGEYEKSKEFSQLALQNKPDKNEYFDLLHLSNVMLISHKNNIPVKKLISPEDLVKLKENHVIHPSQVGVDGVALQ